MSLDLYKLAGQADSFADFAAMQGIAQKIIRGIGWPVTVRAIGEPGALQPYFVIGNIAFTPDELGDLISQWKASQEPTK